MSFEALRNLKQLFEEGFIDEQEFTNRKRLIIDQLTKTKLQAEEATTESKDEDPVAQQPLPSLLDTSTQIPSSPIKRKRKVEKEEVEEEDTSVNDSTDLNETYTWSELIERALMSLGGSRTGHEITDWIEEKFGHIVNHKTKTWKNSVFGCLSSNARKRWLKEQSVVNGKRRFVWRLNRGGNHHIMNLPIPEIPPLPPKVVPLPPELSSPLAAKTLSALSSGPKKSRKLVNFDSNGPQSPSKASLFLLSSLASTTTPTKPKKTVTADSEFPLLDEDTPLEAELNMHTSDEMASPNKSDLDSSFLHRPDGTPAKDIDPASFLSLVEQCLHALGGKRSGAEIAEWIAVNFPNSETVVGNSKRSLRYSVNATLSSKKHSGLFAKDTSSDRTLWYLS